MTIGRSRTVAAFVLVLAITWLASTARGQQPPPFVFVLNASVDVQDPTVSDLGGDSFISPCDQPSGQKSDTNLHGAIFFANKTSSASSAVFTVRTASFIVNRLF